MSRVAPKSVFSIAKCKKTASSGTHCIAETTVHCNIRGKRMRGSVGCKGHLAESSSKQMDLDSARISSHPGFRTLERHPWKNPPPPVPGFLSPSPASFWASLAAGLGCSVCSAPKSSLKRRKWLPLANWPSPARTRRLPFVTDAYSSLEFDPLYFGQVIYTTGEQRMFVESQNGGSKGIRMYVCQVKESGPTDG